MEMPKEIWAGVNIAGNKWHESESELDRAGIPALWKEKYALESELVAARHALREVAEVLKFVHGAYGDELTQTTLTAHAEEIKKAGGHD